MYLKSQDISSVYASGNFSATYAKKWMTIKIRNINENRMEI